MVNKFGQRPIYRFKSSVMTHITLEEWPTDVPLPNTFTLHETEDGVIHPLAYLS